MNPLGQLIQARIDHLQLSQAEAARRIGITRWGLGKLMKQPQIRVQVATRRKISEGLGIPLHLVQQAAQDTDAGIRLEHLTVRQIGDVLVSALDDATDQEVEEAAEKVRAELRRIVAERRRRTRRAGGG